MANGHTAAGHGHDHHTPSGLKRYLYSTNHKDIGSLYLVFGVWCGIIGIAISNIIRMEVGVCGDVLGDVQLFNVIITAHALVIIFFLVMPVILGGFGN